MEEAKRKWLAKMPNADKKGRESKSDLRKHSEAQGDLALEVLAKMIRGSGKDWRTGELVDRGWRA